MSRIKNNCYAMQQNEFIRTRVVCSLQCEMMANTEQSPHLLGATAITSQHIHSASPIKLADFLTDKLREAVACHVCFTFLFCQGYQMRAWRR